MKTYKLLGGGTINADSELALVYALNYQSKFGFKNDIKEFMLATAEACKLQSGDEIRTSSEEIFVADLIKYGYLEDIDNMDINC